MTDDIFADLLRIPPDRAEALRFLAHNEPAILAYMEREGDRTEVPRFGADGYKVWVYVAVMHDGRLRAQFDEIRGLTDPYTTLH